MHRLSLIPLTTMMMAALVAGNVNAQEALPRKITVGPAIEFGNGTAFGIQAKIPIGSNFSVRPIILFGYQADVSITVNRGTSSSSSSNPFQEVLDKSKKLYSAVTSGATSDQIREAVR